MQSLIPFWLVVAHVRVLVSEMQRTDHMYFARDKERINSITYRDLSYSR